MKFIHPGQSNMRNAPRSPWNSQCLLKGVDDKILFDLCFARGLDIYTGLIFEVMPKLGQVDSIAAACKHGAHQSTTFC